MPLVRVMGAALAHASPLRRRAYACSHLIDQRRELTAGPVAYALTL